MGDRGEKSRSFAKLRMTVIGIGMTAIGIRMSVLGMGRVEAAGAVRCVVRLRGKHEGF